MLQQVIKKRIFCLKAFLPLLGSEKNMYNYKTLKILIKKK